MKEIMQNVLAKSLLYFGESGTAEPVQNQVVAEGDAAIGVSTGEKATLDATIAAESATTIESDVAVAAEVVAAATVDAVVASVAGPVEDLPDYIELLTWATNPSDPSIPSIPDAFEEFRTRHGLSIKQFAKILGTTSTHYTNVVLYKTNQFSISSLKRAYAIGIASQVLLKK